MYFPTTLVALVPLAVFSAIEAAPIAGLRGYDRVPTANEPPQFSGNLNSRTMGFRLAGNEIAESIFRRDSEEFIGWHGTNSITASFWMHHGTLDRPPARQILSNYLGISNSSFNTLTSGADAQLGDGLYISDNQDTAIGYAHMNAVHNPGTEPRVCAIFARSSNEWRNEITKVFIPDMLVGDAGDKKRRAEHEAHRASYLKHIVPNVPTQNIVKISRLDKTRPKLHDTNQLLIPGGIPTRFSALCAHSDVPFRSVRVPPVRLNYLSPQLHTAWKILGTVHV